MGTAIVIYILLLIIFLIVSSLILRHTMKYNYLSPHFKYIVGGFGIIAVMVIIFSIYLLFKMGSGSGSGNSDYSPSPTPTIPKTSSGDLNF